MSINASLRIQIALSDLHIRTRHLLHDPSEKVELPDIKIVVMTEGANGIIAAALSWNREVRFR